MIAHLSGKLKAKTTRTLIVDVNGVGYQVFVSTPLLESAEMHLPINLHIHTIVREDEISLYGFEKYEDLQLFQLLISVNGVGPRTALDCFTSPIENIKAAIIGGDIATLTLIQGIGKKTAERIILELKEKIGPLAGDVAPLKSNFSSEIHEEATHALLGLGYKRGDINRIFRGVKEPISDTESLIKYFLKYV